MYYIYHIKGVKIGCSTQVNKRVKAQGYTEFEILEEHIDIYEVSKREIELQKQYGYESDNRNPYYVSVQKIKTAHKRREVFATNLSDNTITKYNSIKEAGLALNILQANIHAIINGTQKTAKGYKFKAGRLVGIKSIT